MEAPGFQAQHQNFAFSRLTNNLLVLPSCSYACNLIFVGLLTLESYGPGFDSTAGPFVPGDGLMVPLDVLGDRLGAGVDVSGWLSLHFRHDVFSLMLPGVMVVGDSRPDRPLSRCEHFNPAET